MAIPEVLTRAIAAARAGDADTVRRLVDWPMTGASVMLNTLDAVDEADRAGNVAEGLAELDGAADDPAIVGNILAEQAEFLVPATDVRAADEVERAGVVASLRIRPVPAGLTPEQMARVDGLRARAELISDVYTVEAPAGRQPYAIAPDTGLLVLLLG
jgi:hypothetical protein